MKATSGDGAFEFQIEQQGEKILVRVYSNISHSFDTTGHTATPREFTSVSEAKEWAQKHLSEALKVPGTLEWD